MTSRWCCEFGVVDDRIRRRSRPPSGSDGARSPVAADATVTVDEEITRRADLHSDRVSAVFLRWRSSAARPGDLHASLESRSSPSMLLSVWSRKISPADCERRAAPQGWPPRPDRGPFGGSKRGGLERVVHGDQGGVAAEFARAPFRWLIPYLAICRAMVWRWCSGCPRVLTTGTRDVGCDLAMPRAPCCRARRGGKAVEPTSRRRAGNFEAIGRFSGSESSASARTRNRGHFFL